MTTPGTQIVSRSAPPSRGGNALTGTWHIVAQAERGITTAPVLLRSLGDYDTWFGGRVSYGMRDAVEAFFRNGGTAVNMIRVVGPAATVATVNLPGAAAAPSLAIDGAGAGASLLSVSLETQPDTRFILKVWQSGTLLRTSPAFASTADAVTWSTDNPYVKVRALGTALPLASAAVALAGGNDDRANITDVHRLAALNLIPKGDGTGQVSIPGATTSTAHIGIVQHAEANNRFAVLDAPNSAVKTDLTAASTAARAGLTAIQQSYAFLVEGWTTIPGLTTGTVRVVPPSALVAALMSARDALTGNPNDPAAGINGIPSFTLGVARAGWSDSVRGELNLAGVNVFREVGGQQRLYGYRTLVDPNGSEASWLSASNARLRMALTSEADASAESFVFSQISKTKIAEYNGVLTGMLLGYYNIGALFGDTPEEAFVVDTGTTVNTPERIAERRLSAVVGVRMNEFAEIVYMEFVKIPVTEELT